MRSAFTFGIALAAMVLASPAYAQDAEGRLDDLEGKEGEGDDLRPTLQTSGLDEDDDLLNPDLDLGPKLPQIAAQAKNKVETEAAEISRMADVAATELQELTELMRGDHASGKAELERRLAASESLEGRVSEVDAQIEGAKRVVRTYGTPLSLRILPRRPATSVGYRGGPDQYRWWQSHLLKALVSFHPELRVLVAQRANELKARGDALSLSLDPGQRPASDRAVRRALERSQFGRGMDTRLNQLLLGQKNTAGGAPIGSSEKETPITQSSEDFDLDEPSGPLVLLPRVRDPLTGRVHVVVNQPLGGPLPAYMKAAR